MDEPTLEELQRAARPSFRMSSAGRRRPDQRGGGEALETIGGALAGSVPAGLAGLAVLPFRGPAGAAETVERVQDVFTPMPTTEGGVRATKGLAAGLSTMGAPAQAVGDLTLRATGSPLAATAAEIALDPLNALGIAAAAKPAARAAAAGARAAGRGARRAGAAAVENLGPKVAELAESYMRRSGMAPEIFVGKSSKTWDAASNARAAEMEAAGIPPQTIWRETGNWRAPDGQWRQEISDVGAKFSPDPKAQVLGDVLKHPDLFKAYPEAQSIKVREGSEAAYFPALGFGDPEIALGRRPEKSSTLHEVTHSIQEREGFGEGSNPELFELKIKSSPEQRDAFNAFANLSEKLGGPSDLKPSDLARSGDVTVFIEDVFRQIDINTRLSDHDWNDLQQSMKRIGIETTDDDRGSLLWIAENAGNILRHEVEKNSLTPYEQYMKTPGEAEARAVQARMNLTPEERRAKFPEESYDVPIGELISGPRTGGSALRVEQPLKTDTPSFREFTGGAPVVSLGGASKHEFQTGKPVVIEGLHGTKFDFAEVDPARSSAGYFMTDRPVVSDEYAGVYPEGRGGGHFPTGGNVQRTFVRMDNPLFVNARGASFNRLDTRGVPGFGLPMSNTDMLNQWAKQQGYDGVIYKDLRDSISAPGGRNAPASNVFVSFKPNYVKSATGNRGTYDIRQRDMTKAQGGAVEGSDMSYSQVVDRIKSGLVQGGMDSGQAMEAALRMAEAKMKSGGAVLMAGGGDAERELTLQARNRSLAALDRGLAPRARKTWDGPMIDRPIVNGKALVSAEELADFRRQFGADKTLRDLLNADKGRGPSAADPRARGPQGASEAPASPYSDPSRVMEGVAASRREIAAPGRDAVEPVAPELALALAPRIAQLLGVSASALRARLAAAGKDWRSTPPRGADRAKWDAIVKQIDEAYPQAAPARVETPPLGTGRSTPDLEPTFGVPQPGVRGVMERPEPMLAGGGVPKVAAAAAARAAARAKARLAEKAAKEAAEKAARAAERAAAKAAKEAEEAAAKAAKEAARTPQQRSVVAKFGQKAEQEARRSAKVRKMEEEIDAPSTPKSSAVGATRTAALPPDYFRQMAKTQGEDAVIRAAERGEHIRPVPGGYVGAPRTVTSPQGLGGMRRSMDKDFMDSVEAVRMADPERLGTWYDRAKMGIAESAEPYQLPRVLEQHGVYSAGVSPEAELGFALKHLNSRVAGQPGMAYRGAPMRTLDEAVAQNRPANMGFKIGEYMEKNDPRVPNTGLFGVNDFRRAQGMGYTDPQGNPWRAGVSDTMHPFMDAETALQVNRARTSGAGGRTDWQGPHIQELPWVYGKAQDLYGRGKEGRFAGDEVEGISRALIEANNTARDYMYKHAGSATHEAIPGASTGHVPDIIVASPEERLKYSKTGRWDRPMPEGPLSAAPTVGAGPRDVIYSALGYRQLPSIEASGAYFPAGKTTPEHQPVTIARPLMDFPTGGEEGLASKSTRDVMDFAERFRAAMDAQEAYGYNLPNTMPTVRDKNAIVLDTRARNPKKLGEPHTGLRPNEQQMADLSKLLDDAGYGIAPTSRGATIFPYDPTATTKQARDLLKDLGPKIQEIFPSNAQLSKNTMGYGPGIGIRTPEGPRASEPFSGQATMNLLSEASRLPENVALNLSESEGVRRAIMDKLNRDAPLAGARPDIQKMREFFAKEDWAKVVDLIRKGMLPAAALTSLGYSPFSMAEER